MEYLRFLPILVVAGGLVGIYTLFAPWVDGYSGIDMMNYTVGGFEKYVPVIIGALSVIAIVFACLYFIFGTWIIPFVTLVLGAAILLLTSVFSLWSEGGTRVAIGAGIGFWLCYLAGALMVLEFVLHLIIGSRKPRPE